MAILRLILGDQLSPTLSSLEEADPQDTLIWMCEVQEEATYVKHHKKKIAFLFSAMRHFALELEQKGFHVHYTFLDDPENGGSFFGEMRRALREHEIKKIVVTQPGEYRLLKEMKQWSQLLGVEVELLPDRRFLCTPQEFLKWAKGRKQLRMEYFYREMRQRYGVLMEGGEPAGGKWNYDQENRRPPKAGLSPPAPFQQESDAITEEVLQLVEERFADHFGHLHPFHFAVTREQALQVLDHFVEERLPLFGTYQDAMVQGEPWMYHSHISFYLNCGLLLPRECLEAAEQAYLSGGAPLNAVEGFVRQILGWREYIRGIYWMKMPQYGEENFFQATRSLPGFYWNGETKMNCLRQCVLETQAHSYAHHIQRLMILGNFALLAGVDPKEVNEWFLIVYADAYEWVELPNVTGMALFADGGQLASKPYAAGGAYVNKMSNYCKGCHYQVSKKLGEGSCPFNYLYWDFLARHEGTLRSNPRMGMIYRTYDKMGEEKQRKIREESARFLEELEEEGYAGELPLFS